MKHAATFLLGLAAGALLAILLTHPTASRQVSAPRPSPSEFRQLDATETTEVPTLRPSATPTTSSGAASATAATDPVPTVAPTPRPTKRPRATTRPVDGLSGVASFVRASLGADYLAARLPRGTRLTVCGPAGCITGVVNDYGPSKRIHPERVVDLSAADFMAVCGPLSMGVCRVKVLP